MSKKVPRSVRNNNPGNIEHVAANRWQGIMPMAERNAEQKSEPRFEVFTTPVYGFRALASLLTTYQDRHGLRTVRGIINRWAPPTGSFKGQEYVQDTSAYVKAVAQAVGVDPDVIINLHEYRFIRPMVEAIAKHEAGGDYWSSETIDEGLRRAGVVKPAPEVAKVPVTKETAAATGVGAIGVGQLAAVADAMSQAEGHISSGSWVRITFGVLTVGLAVFIAYSQVKRHQKGLD